MTAGLKQQRWMSCKESSYKGLSRFRVAQGLEVYRAVTVRVRPGSVAKATPLAQVAGAKRWAWNKRKERHRERGARYKAGQGAKPAVTHYSLRNDCRALVAGSVQRSHPDRLP